MPTAIAISIRTRWTNGESPCCVSTSNGATTKSCRRNTCRILSRRSSPPPAANTSPTPPPKITGGSRAAPRLSTKWAPREWAPIRRPPCSTQTARRGTEELVCHRCGALCEQRGQKPDSHYYRVRLAHFGVHRGAGKEKESGRLSH